MFQFQCGAIGSWDSPNLGATNELFQFQCGAIGSTRSAVRVRLQGCFNSSVVRLVVYAAT